jgi:O-antigen/teichoic acid export membrane protein
MSEEPAARNAAPAAPRNATDGWRSPQNRDGMALVLSSGVASGVGLLYWVIAARLFDPTTVGLNSAAISAMTLIGSAAHLNMGNAMLRFVPVAGRRAAALVAACFGIGIGVAALAGLVFALGSGVWAHELVDAFGFPALLAFFVVSTPIWTIFVLQDAALTAIKRANVVLLENLLFSVLKVAFLAGAAWFALAGGIALSWVIATAVSVVVVNVWLARAVRRLSAGAGPPAEPITVRDIGGFVRSDYAGNVCWQAAVFGLPLVVLAAIGPDGAATFGVVWQIAFALYLVPIGMGKSMVAHAAGRPGAADAARRSMERKTLMLLVPGAFVLAAGSYLVLSLFGRTYAETGTLLLVLLAVSAIPNAVTQATIWAARVRRRNAVLFAVPALLAAMVFGGTWVLLPVMGVTGAGVAWLGAQCLLAAGILLHRRFSRGSEPEQPAPAPVELDDATRPLHLGPYDVHGAGIDDTMPLRLSPEGPRRTP